MELSTTWLRELFKPKRLEKSDAMLSDSSDNEETHQLTINDHFAKAYQQRKEREELQKLKDKYGSDFEEEEEGSDESTDSESAESEDEDGQELTPAVDAAILRTLAMIKRKDPAIYVPGKDVYNEEEQKVTNPSSRQKKKRDKDKSKPVTLRQAAFEAVLEGESRSPSPELGKPTHVEEQQVLRNETIAAFHGAVAGEDEDEDESDEGGGLLVPREKTKDQLEREEEEYRAYLEKEVGSDLKDLITVEKVDDGLTQVEKSSDVEVDSKKKKKKKKSKESKAKSKEQEDHEFLMNYILNRGWIDKSSGHIPTYTEVTSSKKSKSKSKAKSPIAPASESGSEAEGGSEAGDSGQDSDTSFESLNDHFEASYNFRFEEPGAATIPTFPRNLPNTVRRQDSTRKDARARKQERKEAELEQKREDVRRLKNLKMKEIRKKLEKIGKEGGRGKNVDEDQALQQLDLDAEWDPHEHDKQMTRLYTNDVDAIIDEEKPTWEDDIDIGDIHVSGDERPNVLDDSKKDKKKKKKKKKKKGEDEDHIDEGGVDIDEMDADVVRDDDEEEWDGTEEMRKRKLKEYMNELDALDFNDVVAGMKTRFRYAPVKAESFALTPVEILMASDQELNQYVSIKKYAPYRRDAEWDKDRNEKLRELKKQIAERMGPAGMGGEADRDARGSKPAKKRKGRKERMKAKAAADTVENGAEDEAKQLGKREREDEGEEAGDDQGEEDAPKKKRKRRHKKKHEEAELA